MEVVRNTRTVVENKLVYFPKIRKKRVFYCFNLKYLRLSNFCKNQSKKIYVIIKLKVISMDNYMYLKASNFGGTQKTQKL